MPDVSQAQKKAMAAAAAGKSSLGIPKRVGREYLKADRKTGNRPLPKRAGLINKS